MLEQITLISFVANIVLGLLAFMFASDAKTWRACFSKLHAQYCDVIKDRNEERRENADLRNQLGIARKNDLRDPESGKFISAKPKPESEKDASEIDVRRRKGLRNAPTDSGDMGTKGQE